MQADNIRGKIILFSIIHLSFNNKLWEISVEFLKNKKTLKKILAKKNVKRFLFMKF